MIKVNFDPKVDIEKTTEILKEIARDKMGGWFDLRQLLRLYDRSLV